MPLEKWEEVAWEIKSTHFSLGNEKSKSFNLRRSMITCPGFIPKVWCVVWSFVIETTCDQESKVKLCVFKWTGSYVCRHNS